MGRVRHITMDERIHIEQGIREKKSLPAIAKELERANSTILYEVTKNGGKENYTAEKANAKCIECIERVKRKFTEMAKRRMDLTNALPRIQALEMQVQILSDTLKELINAKNK